MNMRTLNIPLPEDLLKLKLNGQFDLVKQMIDLRVKKDIPSELKERLLLEKELLDQFKEEFVYTKEEALNILKNNIIDFKNNEFDTLFKDGAFEFIFIDGQMMFKDDFFANLIKTRKQYAARYKENKPNANFELLDQVITKMEAERESKYLIHVKSTLKIKKEYEQIDKNTRVWLPIPIEYAQVEDFKIIDCNPPLAFVNNSKAKQRCLYFDYPLEEDLTFEVEYSFVNHVVYHPLDPTIVTDECIDEYLGENKPHYIFSDYLVNLTNEVIGDETNPLLKAKKIYDWITSHIIYSYVRPYITLPCIPEYVATSLKGDCGLQASLFITMCRIAHIPARWQAGKYATPLEIGSHDWAQFYVAPYGWLFADCSFGGAAYRAGSKLRRDFYFGNIDPFRIPMASEFMADLTPLNKYTRTDPYDNQNGEVEYEDENITSDMYETHQEIIEVKEIKEEA